MRNLLLLLSKNLHWLLFSFLLTVCFIMIIRQDGYQRSRYTTLEQEVIGRIYEVTDEFRSYLNLRSANTALLDQIVKQESQIQYLKNQLLEVVDSTKFMSIVSDSNYYKVLDHVSARVINNRISGANNLITLNKGSNQGVQPDMGVLSLHGIVGIVKSISPNISIVIPVLNSKFRLSCKLKRSNYFGSLTWDGKDPEYAYLQELPRHAEFQKGDTIVTSEYSAIFPESVPVGIVVSSNKQRDDNFNSLKVKLFTNFSSLSDVIIVRNWKRNEQLKLETEAQANAN